MNSTAIDSLPPEMICKVLKNLNLDDLINCKLVCKQWYSIFQLIKLTKLIMIDDYGNDKFWRSRWYHSDELINQDLEHCKFSSFLSHLKQNILRDLKQLKITKELPTSFDLNQLNLFTKLIHLEINYKFKESCNLNLNLSNLEVLKIPHLKSHSRLSIECPKLKILYFNNERNQVYLNIKYPESVKDLQSNLSAEQLAQFKDVECLKTDRFDLFYNLSETTLRNMSNLKEINYLGSIDFLISCISVGLRELGTILSAMKTKLREFLKLTEELKRPDLKLNFAGIQMTKHNIDLINFRVIKSDGIEYINDDHLYAVNYRHLQDYLPFVYQVDYTQLLKSIGQIPKDYFTKFFAIEKVAATGSIDQAHFLWFLKNLSCLKELDLRYTNSTQSFLDELPTFCSLAKFSLYEKKSLNLNFDFVAKFINLRYLHMGAILSLKSATSLIKAFDHLKYLKNDRLNFDFKKKRYYILRKSQDSNRYDVKDVWEDATLKENLNLDQVVRYFEEIK